MKPKTKKYKFISRVIFQWIRDSLLALWGGFIGAVLGLYAVKEMIWAGAFFMIMYYFVIIFFIVWTLHFFVKEENKK